MFVSSVAQSTTIVVTGVPAVLLSAATVGLFPALWLAVMFFASMGGWRRLARSYPAPKLFHGRAFPGHWGRVNRVRYKNCLNFAANTVGMHVSLSFLFRFAHRPIFVPWSHVKTWADPANFFDGSAKVQLRFRKVPRVRLHIGRRLAESLAAASGGAFSAPEPEPE